MHTQKVRENKKGGTFIFMKKRLWLCNLFINHMWLLQWHRINKRFSRKKKINITENTLFCISWDEKYFIYYHISLNLLGYHAFIKKSAVSSLYAFRESLSIIRHLTFVCGPSAEKLNYSDNLKYWRTNRQSFNKYTVFYLRYDHFEWV